MTRARLSLLAAALLLLPLSLSAGDKQPSGPSDRMTSQTKLMIMRDLLAERVFTRTVFPRGESGLEIKNGKVIPDSQKVAQAVAMHGFAAKPGDRVVITNVIIKEKSIIVEINGGAKKHEKWYQHVSVGAGGGMTPIGGAPQSLEANGSMVVLAFDKYVPDMTGQQVRDLLAPVFDFKALTQAEAYEKTLPPKVQNAIKNHEVLVGMDRDMVIYAKGRPQQKVRDKDDKGIDYEEWIFGAPPEEVQFVRFEGRFVTRLEIMKVDGEKIVRTEKEVDLPSQETQIAVKSQPKPPGAPTLRRPGEKSDDDGQGEPLPNTPYPAPTSMPQGGGMPGTPGSPGAPAPQGMPPQ